jgi:hypothetical protein
MMANIHQDHLKVRLLRGWFGCVTPVDGWQQNGTAAFRRVATEMKKNDE